MSVLVWIALASAGAACLGLLALYLGSRKRARRAVAHESEPAIAQPRPRVAAALLEGVSLVEPAAPATRVTPPREAIERVASQLAKDALRGRLNYAVATAEITPAGIDARREDGAHRLVLYRDVVGIVARRLPVVAPYEGSPFVDVISTADSTLRILPWTRLTGDAVNGENVVRARALVQLLVERCGKARLDRATQRFLTGAEPPAQIPDEATLDQHDQRLA